MHIAEDIIKKVEAQFKMDCALDPSGEAGKRGYLIGRRLAYERAYGKSGGRH